MTPTRRVLILAFAAITAIILLTSYRSSATTSPRDLLPNRSPFAAPPDPQSPGLSAADLSQATLSGHAIAPKLGNETAKAELGRATWKYFHTVMARFPDKPTPDESAALKSYIHLFQRLYPCGECASHFGEILKKFPPQVSSRSAAAAWACHVHNEVNKSLEKDIFDCSKIGDFYDCGCAEDEEEEGEEGKGPVMGEEKAEMSDEAKEMVTGVNGRDMNYGKFVEAANAGFGVGVG